MYTSQCKHPVWVGKQGLCVTQESRESLRKGRNLSGPDASFSSCPQTLQACRPASGRTVWAFCLRVEVGTAAWIHVSIPNPGIQCPNVWVTPSISPKPWPVFPQVPHTRDHSTHTGFTRYFYFRNVALGSSLQQILITPPAPLSAPVEKQYLFISFLL